MKTFLKFYTPSCQVCKVLDRFLESKKKAGLDFSWTPIDCTDEANKELVAKYGVTAVPTLVNVETGEKIVGFASSSCEEFLR